jgi:putative ABC transport system permease protein
MNFWKTASRIAWRETRSSTVKFGFVILAVAVGVGALSGVRGFSDGFASTLLREARTIMAADLSVRIFGGATPDQQALLDRLQKQGAQYTHITETLTMANTVAHPEPLMVSVKAVDPAAYPYYGEMKLDPPAPRLSLDANSVGVAEDVLVRLNAKLGDTMRLGGQEFRIASTILSEPDRMSGSLNLGLRVMITREGLERTGLIRVGSRAANRFLFKLPEKGLRVDPVKNDLKAAFPEGQVIDFRETNPTITRSLDRATRFLMLVSLIALLVGALGVATTMQSHLQQKLDGIAVMKSMGGSSMQIVQIYLVQTVLLALAGSFFGLIFGAIIQLIFPVLLRRYFNIEPGLTWSWPALLQGLGVGLLSTLLFTLVPLLRIRSIRPVMILRRDMSEKALPWWKRWLGSKSAVAVGATIVIGLGLISSWLSDARIGAFFVGGLIGSLAVLSLVAWLLLKGLRLFLRKTTLVLPSSLRHGIANLYRPGNQAQTVLVALGVGVTFILTIYLVQNQLIRQLVSSAPPGMPNVFLIDITPELKDGVVALVSHQPGVEGGRMDITPAVAARMKQVNGVPLQELDLKGWGRRFLQTRTVTFAKTQPDGFEVYSGEWWDASQVDGLVGVAEDAAKILNIVPGSVVDFEANGRPFRAKVAALFRTEGFRMGAMSEFVFTPKTLEGMPAIYYGGARVESSKVALLQKAAYEKYPTVTVINIAEALAVIQEVVDQAALVIRFLSVFAILAGIIVLASSVAGSRFRRIREVVILKTLGGTRRRIANIFSIEFLVLGAVAGLMGGLLGSGFSAFMLRRVWEADSGFAVVPVLVAIAVTAILANAAGWLASARILGQKPLEVLRDE